VPDYVDQTPEDVAAVRESPELGDAPLRPIAVFDRDFLDPESFVEGVQRHVGFDLEPVHEYRIARDERAADRSVPSHDVAQIRPEQPVDDSKDKAITKAVEPAFVLRRILPAGQAIADDHVGLVVNNRPDEVKDAVGDQALVFGWLALKVRINPDFTSLLPPDAEVNKLLKEYGGTPAPADLLVFAVTATELAIKTVLLKPIVGSEREFVKPLNCWAF